MSNKIIKAGQYAVRPKTNEGANGGGGGDDEDDDDDVVEARIKNYDGIELFF